MLVAISLLFVLPILVTCLGEGNIHLLKDEIATALQSCSHNETTNPARNSGNIHRSRSNDYHHSSQYIHQIPRIDNTKQDTINLYGHEKRNFTRQVNVLNRKDDIPSYGRTDTSIKYARTTTTPPGNAYNYNQSDLARRKRKSYLINKSDRKQCLSQCVFANLHVVDEQGMPRETELWKKMQTAITSQQSRTLLKDQVRACFQELQSENDDDGCSYSNKLERCLMLRLSDRKLPAR